MWRKPTNLIDWRTTYSTQQACFEELKRQHWLNGFVCPRCDRNQAFILPRHILHQCKKYHYQTLRQRGKSHGQALRTVVDQLLDMICVMLPYMDVYEV